MSQSALAAPKKDLTLADLFLVFRRRRKAAMAASGACLLLGIAMCVATTRKYTASGLLEIEKSNADMLGPQSMMAAGGDGPGDALNANLDLQTESEILQSDTLALSVVKVLHLEKTKDFQSNWSPLGWAAGLITPSGQADPRGASLDDSPTERAHLLKTFAWNLKVKPVAGTRLIKISYTHSDPKIAAAAVNALMKALKDYGFETRYSATSESSEWLSGQLAELKKQAQDLQAKVVGLRKYSGVYSLGTDSQGRDQVYSETLDRLQQATTALTDSTSNRIMKGAVYQTVKDGDPELISGLAGVEPDGIVAVGAKLLHAVADAARATGHSPSPTRAGQLKVRFRLPSPRGRAVQPAKRRQTDIRRSAPHRPAVGQRPPRGRDRRAKVAGGLSRTQGGSGKAQRQKP